MSQRGRPFEPGNQFGRGRPRGSRNKTTARMQELLNQYAEPVLKKAIGEALKGDTSIMRPLLDRILPVRREAPVTVGALPTATGIEVSKASETVIRRVTSGKLTILEGGGLLHLLDTRRRTIETEELEKRIRSLESKA